jgi:tellurite resistance protein TerC
MGGTVLLIGIAAIVLPLLPAFVVIPAGLAILATEFAWAKRWLNKTKEFYEKQRSRFKQR